MKQENQLIMSLKQIQQDFHEAVLNRKNTVIAKQIRPNQITPEFRFSVYRNTILQNLRNALELTFPAIWKLVGKECADSLAFAFIQDESNLPITNCLDDWGKKFPEFLQSVKPIAHLFYLKDIAELEWLKHLSYGAADYRALSPVRLQKYLVTHIEELYLIFNPTVLFYSSPYSLKNIFDLIENPVGKDKIDLQLAPCYAVITRQYNQVMIHWVSQAMFDFFNYLKKRFTFMQSCEYILKTNPDFDLVAALEFMLKNELLWKCSR